RRDQTVQQLDVGRAEAAEADVDERAVAGRQLERPIGRADARLEALPGLAERAGTLVVGLGRVEVEVHEGRLVHELELRQRRRPALLAEGRELALQRLVQ